MPSAPRGITRRSCRRCRDRLVSRRMPSDGRADEQEASASGPTDAPRARTRPGSSTTSNVMEQDSSDARYPDPVDVANPRRPDLSGSSPIDRATATRIMCCQLCVGCVRRRMRAHVTCGIARSSSGRMFLRPVRSASQCLTTPSSSATTQVAQYKPMLTHSRPPTTYPVRANRSKTHSPCMWVRRRSR